MDIITIPQNGKEKDLSSMFAKCKHLFSILLVFLVIE